MSIQSQAPKSQGSKYVIIAIFGNDYIQYSLINNSSIYKAVVWPYGAGHGARSLCDNITIGGIHHFVLDAIDAVDIDEAYMSLEDFYSTYNSADCGVTVEEFMDNIKEYLESTLPKELLEGIYDYQEAGIFSPFSIGVVGVIPNV